MEFARGAYSNHYMTERQVRASRLSNTIVIAAESIRVAGEARETGTERTMTLGVARGPGCTRVCQVAGILALSVIANFVIRARQVRSAARRFDWNYVRRGTWKSVMVWGNLPLDDTLLSKFCTDKEETPFLQHRIKKQEDTKDLKHFKRQTGYRYIIKNLTLIISQSYAFTQFIHFI